LIDYWNHTLDLGQDWVTCNQHDQPSWTRDSLLTTPVTIVADVSRIWAKRGFLINLVTATQESVKTCLTLINCQTW